MGSKIEENVLAARWQQVLTRLDDRNLDAVIITGGADMAYLTGYEAMPLERITALVVSRQGGQETFSKPVLLVPELERVRVTPVESVFDVVGWDDDTDPTLLLAERVAQSGHIAVSNAMWSAHLLDMSGHLTRLSNEEIEVVSIGAALGGLRSVKSADERQSMVKVGGLADRVATALQSGQISLIGQTEQQVAEEISRRLLEAGHETVEFVIVASGPNSASPHHRPTSRIIQADEMVLCDFGGKHHGFCSDTTRCVYTGEIPEDVATAYAALQDAQQAAVDAAIPGAQLKTVDQAARSLLTQHGYGEYFVHRTGHGIGVEVHEEPYVTGQANQTIVPGHVFSIEPGIYIPGEWGMRLEDIVVVEDNGPVRANNADHRLKSVVC